MRLFAVDYNIMLIKKKCLSFEEMLADYLPPKSLAEVCRLLMELQILLKIVPPRRTLQGSYRIPTAHQPHYITINDKMNPYTFLITLLHEIAHAHAWTKHKTRGHQKDWKVCFGQLLTHFIQLEVFPADIKTALEKHIEKITYCGSADINLSKILQKYDNNTSDSDSESITLQEIPKDTVFSYGKTVFRKGEPLRKYIKCKNLSNNKTYRCHPLMMVKVIR